ARPEPSDGMVTFRISETPASEIRDCLPAIVLDTAPTEAKSLPVAVDAGGAKAYSYADQREPEMPALKPRAAPSATPASAAAPNPGKVAPTKAAFVGTPAPIVDTPVSSPPIPASEASHAPSGVVAAPYKEGASGKGLSLVSDGPQAPVTAVAVIE